MRKEVMPARSFWFPVFAIRATVAALLFWGWTMSTGCAAPAAARIALVPEGPETWPEQLAEAIGYWNVALHERCGEVFEVGEQGLPVRLYESAWPEADTVLGYYDGTELAVKATGHDDVTRATLVHELGHVFLLGHTLPADDPDTVMCSYIRPAYYVPTAADAGNAILALGC